MIFICFFSQPSEIDQNQRGFAARGFPGRRILQLGQDPETAVASAGKLIRLTAGFKLFL
jgi:hypothetical protein